MASSDKADTIERAKLVNTVREATGRVLSIRGYLNVLGACGWSAEQAIGVINRATAPDSDSACDYRWVMAGGEPIDLSGHDPTQRCIDLFESGDFKLFMPGTWVPGGPMSGMRDSTEEPGARVVLAELRRLQSEMKRLAARCEQQSAGISRVVDMARRAKPAASLGCLCPDEHDARRCGGNRPVAWSLDPAKVIDALSPDDTPTCGRAQAEGWCPDHGYGTPPEAEPCRDGTAEGSGC